MTTTESEQLRLVKKAVRVRNLNDPLGAMGFRNSSGRIRRETRVRRITAALTGACFVGILGTILATANVRDSLFAGATDQREAALQGVSANAAVRVIPVQERGSSASGGNVTGIRVSPPKQSSHSRTKGS